VKKRIITKLASFPLTFAEYSLILSQRNQEMNKSKSAPSLKGLQEAPVWKFHGIKAYIGVSGPYNTPELFKNMITEGSLPLNKTLVAFLALCAFKVFFPFHVLQARISSLD